MEYKITGKMNKKVINEILEVKKKKGLTAKSVVEKAKNKTSAMHKLFEWDNTKAGEAWRIQQARVLINEVKIIVENKEYYAFENVNVALDTKDSTFSRNEYFHRNEIISNNALRQQMVDRAYNYVKYWREQYKQYNEFGPIFEGIDRVETKFKKKKVKVKAVA